MTIDLTTIQRGGDEFLKEKRQGGRPKKEEGLKLQEKLLTYVKKDEKIQVEQKASSLGMSTAAYLRYLILESLNNVN